MWLTDTGEQNLEKKKHMTTFLDETPLRLENGLIGIPWQVNTANPTNFHEAISKSESIESVRIWAQTFLPEGAANPAVVLVVPGSLGIADSHIHKARLLTDAGIAACLIDPFGTRGVASTVANQAQYSFAASAWDVVAATEQVADHADIDKNRIGAQGHSRGGSAVLMAASMFQLLNSAHRISGVYAAYPWSGMQFLNPSVGKTRIRSIIGDQDEWCSPQQVQGHMQAIRLTGCEASCRIVPGAQHSFDRFSSVEEIPDASVAPGAPTIYLMDDGTYIHPATGEADPATDERSLMLYGIQAGYGRRGAKIGSDKDYAGIFHNDMMTFWQDLF